MRRENLELVIEECAEVIQAATKILRFGVDDRHPDYYDGMSNSQALAEEVGQLLHCIDRLNLPMDDVAGGHGACCRTIRPQGD